MNLFILICLLFWEYCLCLNHPGGAHLRSGVDLKYTPLKEVEVNVRIKDFLARVEVIQTYINNSTNLLECVYIFPLDEKASIVSLEAELDGKSVKAISKRKNTAQQIYTDSINEGNNAYLLEETSPDILKLRVGSLPPSKTASIKITYITKLDLSDNSLRFTFPTTFTPRYNPQNDINQYQIDPPRKIISYQFLFNMNVNMSSQIQDINSPSHDINVDIDDNKAKISLGEDTFLSKDFILQIATQQHNPRVWVEIDENDTLLGKVAMMLSLESDYIFENLSKNKLNLDENIQPLHEVVFIIDKSGSMEGDAIRDTKESLLVALQFLKQKFYKSSDILFNLVTFDKRFNPLFQKSQLLTEENLIRAKKFVEDIQPYGGTEILPPLNWLYNKGFYSENSQKSIIVLTDGSVVNTEQVIEIVKNHSAKVFSIGLGYAASTFLVNGIAKAGKGVTEYVFPGENVERKIIRQLERVFASDFINIQSIDFGTGGAGPVESPIITPANTNTLYPHSQILLFSFLNEIPHGDITIHLENGQKIIIENSQFKILTDNTLHLMGARSMIRDLEEGKEEIAKNEEQVEKIISIAEKYNLMSKETSLVGVIFLDNNNKDNSAYTDTIHIPLPLPYQSQQYEINQPIPQNPSQPSPSPFAVGSRRILSVAEINQPIPQYPPPPPSPSPFAVVGGRKIMSFIEEQNPPQPSLSPFVAGGRRIFDENSSNRFFTVPLSIGVDVNGYIQKIVDRSTILPTRNSIIIKEKLELPFTSFIVRIFEGEMKKSTYNFLRTQFEIVSLLLNPHGECELEITIDIDANTHITVTAKDLLFPYNILTRQIQPNYLTDLEIENMINNSIKEQSIWTSIDDRIKSFFSILQDTALIFI